MRKKFKELKKFIIDLRERGYYPIYVKDPAELLQGNFSLRVSNVFKEQYETEVELSDLNEDKIVALVDDLNKKKNKEKTSFLIFQDMRLSS